MSTAELCHTAEPQPKTRPHGLQRTGALPLTFFVLSAPASPPPPPPRRPFFPERRRMGGPQTKHRLEATTPPEVFVPSMRGRKPASSRAPRGWPRRAQTLPALRLYSDCGIFMPSVHKQSGTERLGASPREPAPSSAHRRTKTMPTRGSRCDHRRTQSFAVWGGQRSASTSTSDSPLPRARKDSLHGEPFPGNTPARAPPRPRARTGSGPAGCCW